MGVTIEQYGAQIGVHDTVRIQVGSTQLEGNFCETMLMLFQLVITIILMLIFFPSVIYLPTKRLTEQYKSLSQVIVSFTQMSCYNV